MSCQLCGFPLDTGEPIWRGSHEICFVDWILYSLEVPNLLSSKNKLWDRIKQKIIPNFKKLYPISKVVVPIGLSANKTGREVQ